MITKIKVWRSPANEYRVYVETDERQDGGPKSSRTYPVEGCYYLTGNHWHPAKSWDGNLNDEQKAEARRLSIKDGKWTTWYAPTAPAKPVEKQPDAKELARKAKYEAERAFVDAHGGVIASTDGRISCGEFVSLQMRDHSEQVLISAGFFYTDDAQSEGENAGWYTSLCEPTAEEKQSAEYQKLQERVKADADHLAHVTEQARLAAHEDGWDDVDWDMSLACNAGHHDNCNGQNCTCDCHKPAPKADTFIPSVGPSDADFTRQFEHNTGIKTMRDDGGRDLGFYDFTDLKILAGETHISGACDPDHFGHQCGPCYDNRCQCACHQPVPQGADFYQRRLDEYQQMRSQTSGSARTTGEPERHEETVEQPTITSKKFGRKLSKVQARLYHHLLCTADLIGYDRKTGKAKLYRHEAPQRTDGTYAYGEGKSVRVVERSLNKKTYYALLTHHKIALKEGHDGIDFYGPVREPMPGLPSIPTENLPAAYAILAGAAQAALEGDDQTYNAVWQGFQNEKAKTNG